MLWYFLKLLGGLLINTVLKNIVKNRTFAPMEVTTPTPMNTISVDFDNLEFGKVFADTMVVADYDGEKWSEFEVKSLETMAMHPATSVFHYGQAIFEGLKAYKSDDGRINIFRLKDNIARLNKSAHRMMMPQLDADKVEEIIKDFVASNKAWIPAKHQGSLYIRPFMISTDPTLRAVSSKTFRFVIIACPVGFYYDKPLSVYLEKSYSRAGKGGIGYAKAAGNYAASFYPSSKAKNLGFDQVLWTNVSNNFSLEELGSANFFYVKNGAIRTPSVEDSILRGITRATVIQLARDTGMSVTEEVITAEEFHQDLAAGTVECMFATGTAAAITYINAITIDNETYTVESNAYALVLALKERLDAAKFLELGEHDEWNVVV